MMTRSWVPLFISVFVLCLGIAAYVVGVQMGSAVSSTEPGGVVVEAATPADQLPQFTEDGKLIRPHGWESWVMVGASIGLSYSEPVDFQEPTSDDSPGMSITSTCSPGPTTRSERPASLRRGRCLF